MGIRCLTCGTAVPDAAKFCMECGSPAPAVCAACGSLNPAVAKFCRECGARLPPRAADAKGETASPPTGLLADEPRAPAERRQLTVLFCDLVDSTALSLRLDPEDLRDVIGAFQRCVAETVDRYGGFVARYMGDGALVYFGYPQSHEDNAERALRAALALIPRIVAIEGGGAPLHARIGVATGLVVVGELVNAGSAREFTALGDTLNLAARLQAVAEPDAIVVSDSTHRLTEGAFEYRDLGPLKLKGFDVPARGWRVLGRLRDDHVGGASRRETASREAPATAAGPTPLVGREQERALLRARWEEAKEGQGGVVILSGEAGVGKSRLVQVLLSDVEPEPRALIEFRCSAYYANSPLFPVVHVLRIALGWNREDSDEVRYEKLEAFCAQNHVTSGEGIPLLALLLSLPASPRFLLPAMSPERRRQRTLQTLLDVLMQMTTQAPVLLVIEDLQWMDPTTMELLSLLVGQVATVRLLAVATARLEFRSVWPPHSHVTSLMLSRLTQRQTARMIERVAVGRALPPEVLREIVEKTDGVPLFVEELTKMVLESGLAQAADERTRLSGARTSLAIPLTLQDSLTARLDRLSTVKVVAQLCAALGREFSYAMLKAVADLDEPTLQKELARLVEAELLYQRGVLPEATFLFKHALIQEAAYQSLLRSARQHYHQRIAHVVIEQFPAEAASRPEFVAMHFAEAGKPDEAVGWWRKAAQLAVQRASYAEAIAHYEKGVSALQALPPSIERDRNELGLQVELGYALIPVRGWAATSTADAFRRAGVLSRQRMDTPAQFRALWGLGAFHFVRGNQHEARRVADQCIEVAMHGSDIDASIEAQYLSGIVSCARGEFSVGRSALETCLGLHGTEERESHRLLYGQDARASALGWLALEHVTCGDPDGALACAQEGLAYVQGGARPFLLARGLAGVGFVHVFRREPFRADEPLAAALALCAEQGFTYFHAIVSAFQGANLVNLGRTDEGVALMHRSVQSLRAIGAELLFTLVFANLAAGYLALRRIGEGLVAIDDGFECIERLGEHWGEAELHRLRGQLLLCRGGAEAEKAIACFTKALETARAQGAHAFTLRAASDLVRLSSHEGDGDDARSMLVDAISLYPAGVDIADTREARTLLQSPR